MEADIPIHKIPLVTLTPKGIFKYVLICGEYTWKGDKK